MRALVLAAIAAQWSGTAPRGSVDVVVSAELATYTLVDVAEEDGALVVAVETHEGPRSRETYPALARMLVDVERELVVSQLGWCGLGVTAEGWS